MGVRGLRARVADVALSPAQIVVAGFALLVAMGTLLLRLPVAVDAGVEHPGWLDSLFWATSASTVTGLGTVDVATFSSFGEVVLLCLVQMGGFGIMTAGSVIALVAFRRVGLRQRLLTQTELGPVDVGELRSLIWSIAKITIAVETFVAIALFAHLVTDRDVSAGRAAYSSVFHAVSAFNNAGIALSSDSLTAFADDPFVVFPVTFAFVIGGLGFPVLVELRRRAPLRQRSLHTKITLAATLLLLVVGTGAVLAFEWTNDKTLGSMDVWDKMQAAWFQGVTPRTAGFNTIDIGELREPTLGSTIALMFIGAGPASTSGGIKITTFAVLGLAIAGEMRGKSDTTAFGRRIPDRVVRQAMTLTLVSVGLVFATAIALTTMSSFDLTDTIFEATSAFGTVGLSTGITGDLPAAGHVLLVISMFAGRVGPLTFIAAFMGRRPPAAYRLPEERPIVG